MKGAGGGLALLSLFVGWGGGGAAGRSAAPFAAGSGTAFSFSGGLAQPNGKYDLLFNLFPTLTGGTRVAGPRIAQNVQVTGHRYATRIDFGSNPFSGGARFVQVGW